MESRWGVSGSPLQGDTRTNKCGTPTVGWTLNDLLLVAVTHAIPLIMHACQTQVRENPNVVEMLGICETDYVAEYLPSKMRGYIREEKINGRPLSLVQRIDLALGAARGLHGLHEAPGGAIVHLDIKPEQFLVNGAGLTKIYDLNLAWFMASAAASGKEEHCPFTTGRKGGSHRAISVFRAPEYISRQVRFFLAPSFQESVSCSLPSAVHQDIVVCCPFPSSEARACALCFRSVVYTVLIIASLNVLHRRGYSVGLRIFFLELSICFLIRPVSCKCGDKIKRGDSGTITEEAINSGDIGNDNIGPPKRPKFSLDAGLQLRIRRQPRCLGSVLFANSPP